MEGIQTFKGSWPWPWPWIRPYGIPSCITHRPLPVYQISFKSKKLCGRTDGRTDVRTDGHFFPYIIIGRLLEVDLKIMLMLMLTAGAHKWSLICCVSVWFDWFMHRLIVSIPSTRTSLRYCRIGNWNVHCHRWLRTLRLVQPSIRGTSLCLTMYSVTVIVCRWPSTTPTVWTASVANSVSRRFDIFVSRWL